MGRNFNSQSSVYSDMMDFDQREKDMKKRKQEEDKKESKKHEKRVSKFFEKKESKKGSKPWRGGRAR